MASESKKPSRRKAALEPIRLDEIVPTAVMGGLLSVLEKAAPNPRLQRLIDEAREQSTGTPEGLKTPGVSEGPQVIEIGSSSHSKTPGGTNTQGALELPLVTKMAAPAPSPVPQYPLRPYRCITAQDGHSAVEDRIYNTLWNHRDARQESKDSRTLTIGYGTLAKILHMQEKNVRQGVRRLLEKQTVELAQDCQYKQGIGFTYRLFGYTEILRRRRAQGLEWAVRNRGGVTFVPAPGTPTPTETPGLFKTPGYTEGWGPGVSEPVEPESLEAPGPGVSEPSLLDKSFSQTTQQTSSHGLAAIVGALHQAVGDDVDDEAADRLLTACRQHAADATAEEISHFIAVKASMLRSANGLRNPLGFLIHAVPKCFVGESFQLYRRAQQQRREAEAAERRLVENEAARLRLDLEAILADPTASEEEKAFARQTLPATPEDH